MTDTKAEAKSSEGTKEPQSERSLALSKDSLFKLLYQLACSGSARVESFGGFPRDEICGDVPKDLDILVDQNDVDIVFQAIESGLKIVVADSLWVVLQKNSEKESYTSIERGLEYSVMKVMQNDGKEVGKVDIYSRRNSSFVLRNFDFDCNALIRTGLGVALMCVPESCKGSHDPFGYLKMRIANRECSFQRSVLSSEGLVQWNLAKLMCKRRRSMENRGWVITDFTYKKGQPRETWYCITTVKKEQKEAPACFSCKTVGDALTNAKRSKGSFPVNTVCCGTTFHGDCWDVVLDQAIGYEKLECPSCKRQLFMFPERIGPV